MSKQRARALREQLKHLRAEWKMWRTGHGLSGMMPCFGIDFLLVCDRDGCQDPTCEGCAATAYRADRCGEIEAKAATLKAELVA